MERDQVFDMINFLVSLAIFALPVYFAYAVYPLWIQVSPAVLLIIPLAIVLHKRRVKRERIEIGRNIAIANKIRVLMVKLERIADIPSIGSSLTYNKQFLSDEIAYLGWRRYFDGYGGKVGLEFAGLETDLSYFLSKGHKFEKKEDFYIRLVDFREIVSSFCHLYDDLARMIKLGGEIPEGELQHIEDLEANYNDFLQALKDSCDEVEEIGNLFLGKYPLKASHEKSTPNH